MENQIETFEEACKVAGVNYTTPEGLTKDEIAYQKLKIVAKAYNGEWEPDWSNDDQRKYQPWFVMDPENFSLDRVFYFYTRSIVSSRLCFKDQETAEKAVNKFIDLYKDYMLG